MDDYRTRDVDVVFCAHCKRPLFTIFVDDQLCGICLDCHRVTDESQLKEVYRLTGSKSTSAPIYH